MPTIIMNTPLIAQILIIAPCLCNAQQENTTILCEYYCKTVCRLCNYFSIQIKMHSMLYLTE